MEDAAMMKALQQELTRLQMQQQQHEQEIARLQLQHQQQLAQYAR